MFIVTPKLKIIPFLIGFHVLKPFRSVMLLILVTFIFLLSPFQNYSQDPTFSQFFAIPLYVNPAFAGISYGPRIIFNYRNQWPSMLNAFVTYAVNYDQHFDALNGGIGFSVLSNMAGNGLFTSNEINGIYSYKLTLNNTYAIKGGLQVGYSQKRLDWGNVLLPDMINFLDVNAPFSTLEPKPTATTSSAVDFAGGIVFYSTYFFTGASVKHVLQPKLSFYDDHENVIPRLIRGHVGGIVKLSKVKRERFYFAPNLVFTNQGLNNSLIISTLINKKSFFGGLSFRNALKNADALIFLIGLSKGILKIGYSYDITISRLSNGSGGAHEISLILNFAEKGDNWRKLNNKVPIPSPVFF